MSPFTRRLSILALGLTAGCMIGPDFEPPAAPVADSWLEADRTAVDSDRQESP